MVRIIVSAVLFAIIYFIFTYYISPIENKFYFDFILSVICGLIFLITFIRLNKSSRFDVKLDTADEIIIQQRANHFKSIEAVGGKLFLLKDYLFFKSHKYNIQKHSLSIPINEIKSYEIYKLFGVFPLGFKVNTLNSKEIFIVDKPKEWMKAIRDTIPQLS